MKTFLLRFAGVSLVALGLVGIILPILPTTPFLLAAAACFVRSSDRLYHWLITNPVFGEYIRRYRDKEGIPKPTKIWTLIFLWTTLGTSALFFAQALWLKLLLLAVGIGVSIHVVMIKTYNSQLENSSHQGTTHEQNSIYHPEPDCNQCLKS